ERGLPGAVESRSPGAIRLLRTDRIASHLEPFSDASFILLNERAVEALREFVTDSEDSQLNGFTFAPAKASQIAARLDQWAAMFRNIKKSETAADISELADNIRAAV